MESADMDFYADGRRTGILTMLLQINALKRFSLNTPLNQVQNYAAASSAALFIIRR